MNPSCCAVLIALEHEYVSIYTYAMFVLLRFLSRKHAFFCIGIITLNVYLCTAPEPYKLTFFYQ